MPPSRPLPSTRLGLCLSLSQVGEVWLRGSCVARGYWNAPEATALTFHATLDGSTSGAPEREPAPDAHHLRTGDLGFVHEGRLFIVGRLKDVLLLRGRTLHAHDLEELAEQSAADALRTGCGAAFAVDSEHGEALVLMLGVPWVAMDSTANILANGVLAGSAFVLFRIFDILKLPPANRIQNLKGGSGILLDDIVAGAQAWAVLKILLLWKSPAEVVACLGWNA